MFELPNGLKVFNGCPHPITFWREGWPSPVSVPVDEVINATPSEKPVSNFDPGVFDRYPSEESIWLVKTNFTGDDRGLTAIQKAKAAGAHLVIGSIIAAQAYPGLVVAMIPAPGYERVPPDQKRVLPDKFTTF